MRVPKWWESREARDAYAEGYDAGWIVGAIGGICLAVTGFLCAWVLA